MSFERILLCGALLCASGELAHAQIAEGPEPNDRNAQPTAYACAQRGTGAISPAFDRDAWRFTLLQPSDLTVFTGAGASAPLPDSTLALYDAASGALLASNDDYPGRGLYSQIDSVALPAGDYLLEVAGYNDSRGSYTLDLVCSGTRSLIPESPEPNETASTATILGCDVRGTGVIAVAGDRDWWALLLGQRLVLEASTASHGSTPVNDTTLRLLDAQGTALAFDDDTGPGLYSRLELALEAGTYYLEVGGFGTAVGGYLLETRCRTPIPAPCNALTPEHLSGFDERDVFEVALAQESDWNLLARARGQALDLRCEVRDERGRLLGRSREDRVQGTRDARFVYRGAPAGRYLVCVDSENGGNGSYDLAVECLPVAGRPLILNGSARTGTMPGGGQAELERTTFVLATPSEVELELDTPTVNGELLELSLYDHSMRRDDDVGSGLPRMLGIAPSCSPQTGLPRVRLGLPAGTFHVVVRGNPDAAPCPTSPVLYQLSARATPLFVRELNPGDASLAIVTRPGQNDLVQLALGTPSEVAFRAETPFSTVDATLFLWSSSGELLGKDDDSAGNLDAEIATRRWPRGDYLLVHRPFDASATAGGPVELFAFAENEIVGPSPIPTTLDLRWRGPSGTQLLAWIAWGTADLPLGAPLDGQYLLLDPTTLLPLASATIGASGIYVLAAQPVADPSLVGTSLHTQALLMRPGGEVRFTNRDSILFR
ncbi:MAG: PPC domain-containing protein [Planctomycetes bacterium]|nr:PPC domain-containing protein [Planctomycetota bacterium]